MEDDRRHPKDRLRRELGLQDATLLIVSGVIGSGVFLTPGRIAELVPHAGVVLLAWVAGGVISLAGALANAELGAMYPRAGGDYVYLREAWHPLAGFLVGWLTFFVIYAGTIATLAAGFAAGLHLFVDLGPRGEIAVAVGLTLFVSGVNILGVRQGARLNNVTAVLKVAALAAFVLVGPVFGAGNLANLRPPAGGTAGLTFAAFGLALSPVLFSYLGWNSSVYVASEIRDPDRTLPRSLFLGLALCTGIYLAVNAVYLYALPVDRMAGSPNGGEAAAQALFGPVAGKLVGAFVLASIFGTLNAMVLIGPRIAYAMALDGLFFRGMDHVSERFHTPSSVIVLQAAVTVFLLLVLKGFERALDYTTFAIVLATIADVLALYRLRRTKPDQPRPYRAWGYPWVPGLYIVANTGIALALLYGRPRECVLGLAMLLAGLPFYLGFRRGSA